MSAVVHSAIYDGRVQHRRHAPKRHRFGYRVYLLYLDLDELGHLTGPGGALQRRWWRPLSFRRADYLGPAEVPLKQAVLDRVERELGRRPRGAVRMLTHLRTWGYVFNPVTFYYCFDEQDRLDCVLAEITNTPWRERHVYVVAAQHGAVHATFAKDFHVSPFLPMEQTYRWRFTAPGDVLQVAMENLEGAGVVFDASLSAARRQLDRATLRRLCLRHPWITAKVIVAIHWNALRLWLKRVPFHVHPRLRGNTP